MNPPRERRVPFEGAENFRDIGGYPLGNGRTVRWGRVYRADNLGGLTDSDRARFAGLGIRTIVDFRVAFERDHAPSRLPNDAPIETFEIDILPEGGVQLLRGIRDGTLDEAQVERRVIDQYRRFVTDTSEPFRRAIACALDEDRLPLLIHCTSGKDRTGFAIAVLLMALGADRETIASDYLLTNEFRRDIGHLFGTSTAPGVARLLTTAKPSYLAAAFDAIDATHGSVAAYLRDAIGLDDAKRAHLRELLTESA